MKKKLNDFKSLFADKSKRIRVLFSVVVLVLLTVVLVTSVNAWVETISTVIIKGEGVIDKPIYTNATINKDSSGAINLNHYFRSAGNMHFSEASSADGVNFYFPVAASTKNTGATPYRKNNINDVCVNYLNFSLKVKSATDASFVFNGVPEITVGGVEISSSAVRMAVTLDGSTSIFALDKSNGTVVSSVSGTKTATNVFSFADYTLDNSGNNNVFSLKSNVEKELTISLWLQEGIENNLSGKEIVVSHLSLIPASPRFKVEATAVTDGNSKNSTGGTVKVGSAAASSYSYENVEKSKSVSLVASAKTGYRFMGWYDSPTGGSKVSESATYTLTNVTKAHHYYARFATEYNVYVYAVYNDKVCTDTTVGSVKAGSKTAGATCQYTALIGEDVTVVATDTTKSKFTGWYTAVTGGSLVSESKSYTITDLDAETKLYARFVDAYTYTAHAVSNGAINSSTGGTVKLNTNSASTNSSVKLLKGETVTAVAAVKSGYTFEGWYTNTTTTGSTKLSSSSTYTFQAGASGTYSNIYAIFTPTYSVTAHAVYNTTNDDSTGGTVKVSSGTAGASSSAPSVKKGSSVTVTATVSDTSKYKFVGWYDSVTGGNRLADENTLTYTFNVTSNTDVYARFEDVASYVIYFNAGHWNKDDAWFAVHAWTDGGSSTTIKMTHVSGNIYKADLGKYYEEVLFWRMDPSKTALDYTSKWNQTADLTVPASNEVYSSNCFTIKSGDWDGATGTWSTYTE